LKVRAIKECPGQLPGSIFEVSTDVGELFIKIGAAERVDDDAAPAPDPAPSKPATRRQYRRRDLTSEPD
jgi:hypothetical protein